MMKCQHTLESPTILQIIVDINLVYLQNMQRLSHYVIGNYQRTMLKSIHWGVAKW